MWCVCTGAVRGGGGSVRCTVCGGRAQCGMRATAGVQQPHLHTQTPSLLLLLLLLLSLSIRSLLCDMGARLWRVRQAGAAGLTDLLAGRRWGQLAPHMEQVGVWGVFRCVWEGCLSVRLVGGVQGAWMAPHMEQVGGVGVWVWGGVLLRTIVCPLVLVGCMYSNKQPTKTREQINCARG